MTRHYLPLDDLGYEGNVGNRPVHVVHWLAGSRPSPFSAGIKMDFFCDGGRIPSRFDRLHSVARRGSNTSTSSWSKKISRGSNSHDFGGKTRMRRRTSPLVTLFKAGREQSVVGRRGAGAFSVAWRTPRILAVYASKKSSAVLDDFSGEPAWSRRRPRRALNMAHRC